MKETGRGMKIKNKIKNGFKAIVVLMFIIGMIPAGVSGLPEQVSVVQAATNIKMNRTQATLIKGQAVQLKLNGAQGKVIWSSSNKKAAVVNATGKVTAKAKGTSVIKAKFRNKTYSCKVQVEIPRISKTSVNLYTNGSYTLKMLDTRQKVSWRSSKTSVATVNSKGKITAKKAGTATITAVVSNRKYTCKVVVKQKSVSTSKVPVCVANQTVYARGMDGATFDNIALPNCFIYIKNLDKNAKVINIKSTNSKIKATKREELDAIEVSGARYSINLLGETSKISFKVVQNKKTYNLSCKITVAKSPSPFSEFKIGSKNFAKYFEGSDNEIESITGKHKLYIKMAQGYVLDSINLIYTKNGNPKQITVKNGATINFSNYDSIYVNYHTTRKPANYVPSSKWYGTVKSPLHDYCVLNIN